MAKISLQEWYLVEDGRRFSRIVLGKDFGLTILEGFRAKRKLARSRDALVRDLGVLSGSPSS